MKFLKEFKEFALKGNVLDLAVGVIIGAAFKSIVDSLTNDIISPILGLFGGVDFSKFEWVLKETVDAETGEKVINSIKYGSFITAIINFIIMAFIIFLIVKGINSLHDAEERLKKLRGKAAEEVPAAPTTKICPFCKSEIAIEATRCPHCTSELK